MWIYRQFHSWLSLVGYELTLNILIYLFNKPVSIIASCLTVEPVVYRRPTVSLINWFHFFFLWSECLIISKVLFIFSFLQYYLLILFIVIVVILAAFCILLSVTLRALAWVNPLNSWILIVENNIYLHIFHSLFLLFIYYWVLSVLNLDVIDSVYKKYKWLSRLVISSRILFQLTMLCSLTISMLSYFV